MTAVLFWILGVALVIAQTTVLQHLPPWLGRPDFLFIFVCFCAYRFAWVPGLILVFSLSWIMDVIVGIDLGFYPLLCLITFAVLKTLTRRSPVKEITYQLPLIGISYFFMQMFLYLAYSFSTPEILLEWSWGKMVQTTLLLVIAAIPLFVLLNLFYKYLLQRQLRANPPRRRS